MRSRIRDLGAPPPARSGEPEGRLLRSVLPISRARNAPQKYAAAGNVPRNNSTESIIGQVDVCPPAPNPRILLASTRHGCESIELIHHSTNSDVYPHPPPSPLTLQHDPKTYNYTLLKNLKVANGDISEIVASMLSPC